MTIKCCMWSLMGQRSEKNSIKGSLGQLMTFENRFILDHIVSRFSFLGVMVALWLGKRISLGHTRWSTWGEIWCLQLTFKWSSRKCACTCEWLPRGSTFLVHRHYSEKISLSNWNSSPEHSSPPAVPLRLTVKCFAPLGHPPTVCSDFPASFTTTHLIPTPASGICFLSYRMNAPWIWASPSGLEIPPDGPAPGPDPTLPLPIDHPHTEAT